MAVKYDRRGASTVSGVIEVDGLAEAMSILRTFEREANREARAAAQTIADRGATRIAAAARRSSRQAALIAPTIRSRRDRFPAIAAGGGMRVKSSTNRRRQPSGGDIFFGAEFGGQGRKSTMQFRPHRGQQGYFFWPTIRAEAPSMARDWLNVLNVLADKWRG